MLGSYESAAPLGISATVCYISLGAQDMFRQSSAAHPKMSVIPIYPYIKSHAQNEH